MHFLPFMVILAIGLSCWNSASQPNWRLQTTVGLIGAIIWLSKEIYRRLHWSAGLSFLLVGCSAVFTVFAPISLYSAYPDASREVIASSAAQSLVFLLCIVIPVLFAEMTDLKWALFGFEVLCLVNCVFMIYNYFMTGSAIGLMNNASINGTFVAIVWPMILFRSRFTYHLDQILIRFLLPFSAIIASGSSTAMSCIPLILLSKVIFRHKGKFLKSAIIAVPSTALIYIVYIVSIPKLSSGNGRWFIWQETLAYYIDQERYIFGNGSGTWQPLIWQVQKINGMTDMFLWAHSEPIQILFEQGALGLSIILLLWITMVRKSWNHYRLWVFVSVIVLGFCTLTQFPFRVYLLALYYSLICRFCFDTEERSISA